MYNRENRPFVNPKAVELRSTRMSSRKRLQLSKQKAAEETELNSDASIEQPETSTHINADSTSDKTPSKEISLQHQRQQTSALREQQQMNTPQQRQRLTTPQQQQLSSSKQKPEILEQRIRKAGGRIPFSLSDENELYEFLLNQPKHLRGNKIYERLAKQNPRHTAQSWRDHALEKYIEKPHFINEWKKKWFPNEKEVEREVGVETTTDVTNKNVEVTKANKGKEVNGNKVQNNEEELSDYMFDLESDDAAAEALILGRTIAQEKEHTPEEEEEEEEQPPIEEEVEDQQNERNYSEGGEINIEIGNEYLPVDDELNESSEDDYSVSEDSGIENGLTISGKTGRTSRQDTSNKIQRQDTLDFDVGPKQKGKRVRQDSDDDDTVEQQWNNRTPSLTPIRQSKEKVFVYNEQEFLTDINQLVDETRRPKEICKVALQMSTYHYETARDLLLFGIRNEIYPRIWTNEEDELLLKYQEDENNLNNIIDKHSIELTKERLSYLKKRNEKNI